MQVCGGGAAAAQSERLQGLLECALTAHFLVWKGAPASGRQPRRMEGELGLVHTSDCVHINHPVGAPLRRLIVDCMIMLRV